MTGWFVLFGSALVAGCEPGAHRPDTRDTAPTGDDPPSAGGPEALCLVEVECYGGIVDEPKSPCEITVTGADGEVAYSGLAGFELRGRSSLFFPKPQYAVELREHSQIPIWPDSIWSYLDDGSDPVPGWRELGYDDTGWSKGAAPLGAAADLLSTTIRTPTTTYFRFQFDVPAVAPIEDVEVGLVRTDGAVVWLNGVEILRDGVPVGATHQTWATHAPPPEAAFNWHGIPVEPSLLVDGANVIAVEIHQAPGAPDDLRFDLYVETSTERSANLFGMGGESDWILNGQYVDRALYRNRLVYDLFQSFGGEDRYATETVFCELELNGEYRGIYTLGERIKRDDDRLDLDDDGAPGETFIVKLDEGEGFRDNAVGFGTWDLVYPTSPDEAEIAGVEAFLTEWEAAVTGPDPADPTQGIFGLLDLDSAVDWVIVQELTKNYDAYNLSVHLWKEPGGKLHFTPWDFDLTMGYPRPDCGHEGWVQRDYRTEESGIQPNVWIEELAKVPAFREALVARWRELRSSILAEDAIEARIDGYRATLEPAIDRNFERWPIEEIAFLTWEMENLLCPVDSYEEEHERVVAFLRGRLAWMDENIEDF